MTIQSVKQFVAEAIAVTEQVSPAEAVALIGRPDVVFVDVREQSELDAAGEVAGSVHIPRGLLEVQTDPGSPMHDPALSSGKRLMTYCATGARAALAAKTLADMGLTRVAHVHGGGFEALRAAGAAAAIRRSRLASGHQVGFGDRASARLRACPGRSEPCG